MISVWTVRGGPGPESPSRNLHVASATVTPGPDVTAHVPGARRAQLGSGSWPRAGRATDSDVRVSSSATFWDAEEIGSVVFIPAAARKQPE